MDPWQGLIAHTVGDGAAPTMTPNNPGSATMNTENTVGTGDLTGAHNTPLHISSLVIAAVVVVILLQLGGFRFVVGANIGNI